MRLKTDGEEKKSQKKCNAFISGSGRIEGQSLSGKHAWRQIFFRPTSGEDGKINDTRNQSASSSSQGSVDLSNENSLAWADPTW